MKFHRFANFRLTLFKNQKNINILIMSEEIPNQLRESYKVPNEEEIIAELDIQDKIHNLADEVKFEISIRND